MATCLRNTLYTLHTCPTSASSHPTALSPRLLQDPTGATYTRIRQWAGTGGGYAGESLMSGFLLVLSVRPEVSGFLPLISEGGRPPYLYILLSRKSRANFDGGATGLHLCRILRHQRFTSPVNCLSQKMHSWLFVQSKLFFHSKNTQQVSNKEEGTLGVQMCVWGEGLPLKRNSGFPVGGTYVFVSGE